MKDARIKKSLHRLFSQRYLLLLGQAVILTLLVSLCIEGYEDFIENLSIRKRVRLLNSLYFFLVATILYSITNRLYLSICVLWSGVLLLLLLCILKIEYFGQPLLPGDLKYLSGISLADAFTLLYQKEAFLLIGAIASALILSTVVSRIHSYHMKKRERVFMGLSSYLLLSCFHGFILLLVPPRHDYSLLLEYERSQLPLYLYQYKNRVKRTKRLFQASEEDFQNLQAQLCPLTDESVSMEAPVDVIVYAVESLIDPSRIPITIDALPLDAIQFFLSNSHTYSLYSPRVGGGSANSIFELLTGLSTMHRCLNFIPFFDLSLSPLWSVPRHVSKNLGYTTTAINNGSFSMYNLRNAYRDLGFEKVVSLIEDTDCVPTDDGLVFCSDPYLVEAIAQELESRGPHFIFAFSDTVHFPYRYFPDTMQYEVTEDGSGLTGLDVEKLAAYLYRLRHVDKALSQLKTLIDKRKNATILIVLGDHPPPLYDTFAHAGIDIQKMTVPMLVYANRDIPSFSPRVWSMNYFPLFLSRVMGQGSSTRDSFYQSLIQEFPIMTRRHFRSRGVLNAASSRYAVENLSALFSMYASMHFRSEKELCSKKSRED